MLCDCLQKAALAGWERKDQADYGVVLILGNPSKTLQYTHKCRLNENINLAQSETFTCIPAISNSSRIGKGLLCIISAHSGENSESVWEH